jgi:hypothetical protein
MVEVTSEDPNFPIESALAASQGPGWRAAEPGEQTFESSWITLDHCAEFDSSFRSPISSAPRNSRFDGLNQMDH